MPFWHCHCCHIGYCERKLFRFLLLPPKKKSRDQVCDRSQLILALEIWTDFQNRPVHQHVTSLSDFTSLLSAAIVVVRKVVSCAHIQLCRVCVRCVCQCWRMCDVISCESRWLTLWHNERMRVNESVPYELVCVCVCVPTGKRLLSG